jgi:lipoprotein-releasing system permease protein
MRLAFFLAIRYLRTPHRYRLAQFTALAAVLGIAAGVGAVIAAQAAARGFRENLQNQILKNTAHVNVFAVNNESIPDWQDLSEKIILIKGVINISAASFDNALLIGKTASSYAIIKGVKSSKFKENLDLKVTDQKLFVEIGKELAEKTDLKVGDTAEIVTGSGTISTSFAPNATAVEIKDVFTTGLYEYDATWIQVSLEDAARLTGKSFPVATVISIETSDLYRSSQIADSIQKQIGANYKVLDWQEANRPLFTALAVERRVVLLIIGLIIFVAALNITTTLALIVNERRGDIAVLKTCGARIKTIISIFLMEGAILGTIGIVAGLFLGMTICFICNQFDLISLPANVYSINQIILEARLYDVLTVSLATLILSLLASVLPALAAAQMRPMENLNE